MLFCQEKVIKVICFSSKKDFYPSLYEPGIEYLSVLATLAPFERISPQSGHIIRPHRASLALKHVIMTTQFS